MNENRTTEPMLCSAEFSTNATVENNACSENSCLNKDFSGKRAVENGEVSVGNSITQDGSICGKFKDVASLQHSYESLQSAFTQKCQQVAKLEKDLQQKTEEITHGVTGNKQQPIPETQTEKIESFHTKLQNAGEYEQNNAKKSTNVPSVEENNAESGETITTWTADEIHAKVQAFVTLNPNFVGLEEYLLTTALSNGNIPQNEHFMEQVSAYTLGDCLLHPQEGLPKQVVKTLAQNPYIQKEVISCYIAELNKPTLPHVMTSKQGVFSAKSVSKMPNSIQEAGKLAQSLFNELK